MSTIISTDWFCLLHRSSYIIYMEQFEKEKFNYHGGYLTYNDKFVARFKYRGARPTRAQFQKCLIKNYSPEEYFNRLDSGVAPLAILRNDGLLTIGRDGTIVLDGKDITRR